MQLKVKPKVCVKCNQAFSCYAGGCWCGELPQIFPLDPAKDCYCPKCLKADVQAKIRSTLKHLSKDDFLKIKQLGNVENPVEGIDFYLNENGYHVFTEWYHLRRGTCCGNGCRHCPYDKKLFAETA